MEHEKITLEKTQYSAKAITGGWVVKCPKCGRSLASGMIGVPYPESVTCNGLEPRKIGINGKIHD